MKKDTISKDILKTIVKDISKHILKFEINQIELLNVELERIESRRADVVAKIDEKFILHLEIQNNNNYDMPYRMLRYLSDINFLAKKFCKTHEVKQFLIYIGKENLTMKNYIKTASLDYNYTIIDMKTIDCNYFLEQDTPDAIVLAVLCDFKGQDPRKIVGFIIEKLQQYTKDSLQDFRKYMLMLEELSTNRDLKDIVKEQEMLSTLRYEDLPSYEIGMEKGKIEGKTEASYELARKMKQEGIEITTISKITGLSIQTIKDL